MADGLFIGLMSGTSVDGIDAALTKIEAGKIELIDHCSLDFPQPVRNEILQLCRADTNEIERMATLDRQLGNLFAEASLKLIEQSGLNATDIIAIGSHGQTVRHQPRQPGKTAFSLQIGDPNTIAENTGITTVADFRRRDIAAGGEGAPLVPAFHQAIFSNQENDRLILNIGGMANISILDEQSPYAGFDTGPGNVLMDGWIQKHQGLNYDSNGSWALSGSVNSQLLERLLEHPFLTTPPPKSTGRESFNLEWLEDQLSQLKETLAPEDVQATLLTFTATTIANAVTQYAPNSQEILCCGGGAHNQALVTELQELLSNHRISDTNALGISPQWVEAIAFAWLAYQSLNQLPGNCPKATGAKAERILGGIYQA